MSKSKVLVPEAREALNRFKMEAANEVDVSLYYYKNVHNLYNMESPNQLAFTS